VDIESETGSHILYSLVPHVSLYILNILGLGPHFIHSFTTTFTCSTGWLYGKGVGNSSGWAWHGRERYRQKLAMVGEFGRTLLHSFPLSLLALALSTYSLFRKNRYSGDEEEARAG
jgi:hypothetical protein